MMHSLIITFQLKRWVPISFIGVTVLLSLLTIIFQLNDLFKPSLFYKIFGDALPFIMYAFFGYGILEFIRDIILYKKYVEIRNFSLFISGRKKMSLDDIDKVAVDLNIFGSPRLLISGNGKLIRISQYKLRANVEDIKNEILSMAVST